MGLLDRLKKALKKTGNVFKKLIEEKEFNEEELEELLLEADFGVDLVDELMERLNEKQLTYSTLKETLLYWLDTEPLKFSKTNPTVIILIGVNGAGKTTTIAKLANYLMKEKGKKVLLAAADTFRAAAIEQLKEWANKLGVDCVAHKESSDAGAVVYDAINAAEARGKDVILVDTAGRLHNKLHLLEELNKIKRVIRKKWEDEPREILLVLDANSGQNAIRQVEMFSKEVGTTGVIVTKLDSTAKAGFIFSITKQLNIPIKFIGFGEKIEDFAPFDPEKFIESLLKEE